MKRGPELQINELQINELQMNGSANEFVFYAAMLHSTR